MILENHAADQEIGFLTKSISKPFSHATTMPPAWELSFIFQHLCWLLCTVYTIPSDKYGVIIKYGPFYIKQFCFVGTVFDLCVLELEPFS